jgi:cell division protein FtsB
MTQYKGWNSIQNERSHCNKHILGAILLLLLFYVAKVASIKKINLKINCINSPHICRNLSKQ